MLYYSRSNRYGFNALLGAISITEYLQDLQIYFADSENKLNSTIKNIVSKYDWIILAFSFFTTQLWGITEIVRRLRMSWAEADHLFYVAGGPHPTGDPLGTLRMDFDIVVHGEGEETFIELLKAIDTGDSLENIKGIAYIEDYKFINTGKRSFVDLNKYPPFSTKYNKYGPIEISRGCLYACFYCQTTFMFGALMRHRNLEQICKYIEILKKHGLNDIRFITPNVFGYGSHTGKEPNVEAIESLLKCVRKIVGKEGRIFIGTFPSEVRPEYVTEETITLIKKYADNDNLIIGAQTGSERMLELIHRGHSLDTVYKAVDLAVKHGLVPNVNFIFGLPGETEQDVDATLKVISDLVEKGARIHVHTFMPLPQTPFAFKPPGKVPVKVKKFLAKLTSKKVVYGSWKAQEELAQKISNYFLSLQKQK